MWGWGVGVGMGHGLLCLRACDSRGKGVGGLALGGTGQGGGRSEC